MAEATSADFPGVAAEMTPWAASTRLPAYRIAGGALRRLWSRCGAGLLSLTLGLLASSGVSAATPASPPDTLPSDLSRTELGAPPVRRNIAQTDRPQSHKPRKYPSGSVVWKYGVYVPDSKDFSGTKAELGMDLCLGAHFSPLLGLELGLGEHTVDLPVTLLGTATQLPLGVYPITISEVIEHRSRIGNVPAGLYALAGPGLYLTSLGDDDHAAIGMQAGVGTYFWLLGIEGRYVWASTKVANGNISINGLILSVNAGVH